MSNPFNKLDVGATYSFPALPEDSCHMAIGGIIAERREDCSHGQVGDKWIPEPLGLVSTVTSVDYESKSITFDVG